MIKSFPIVHLYLADHWLGACGRRAKSPVYIQLQHGVRVFILYKYIVLFHIICILHISSINFIIFPFPSSATLAEWKLRVTTEQGFSLWFVNKILKLVIWWWTFEIPFPCFIESVDPVLRRCEVFPFDLRRFWWRLEQIFPFHQLSQRSRWV